MYTRYGLRGVVVAKFLPGLSTVVPPLAGMAGVKVSLFLLADGLGALLYGGCFIFLGYVFSNQIQQIAAALASIGGSALGPGDRAGGDLYRLQILAAATDSP